MNRGARIRASRVAPCAAEPPPQVPSSTPPDLPKHAKLLLAQGVHGASTSAGNRPSLGGMAGVWVHIPHKGHRRGRRGRIGSNTSFPSPSFLHPLRWNGCGGFGLHLVCSLVPMLLSIRFSFLVPYVRRPSNPRGTYPKSKPLSSTLVKPRRETFIQRRASSLFLPPPCHTRTRRHAQKSV